MATIDLTVKTLDSRNHQFTVPEALTVKELKEHIAEQVGTSAETQRLIYCGRVLQDEKKLTDYDLNGKVVHLVQRAPPLTNPPSGPRPTGPRPGVHYRLDRFPNAATHTLGLSAPPPSGSSSLLRLNTARRMLEDASQSLGRISAVPAGDAPLFVMDNTVEGPYPTAMPFAQAATAAALAAAFSTVQSMGGNNITVLQGANEAVPSLQGSFGFRVQGPARGGNSEPEATTGTRNATGAQARTENPVRNPRVSVFADVIEDMERIQNDLRPHLTTIRQLLRDDPVFESNSAEYRQAQHTYNQVSESLHYLSHAFHVMSDLMVDFGSQPSREVRARPYVYQQAVLSANIPIHASISVETAHRIPTASNTQASQQPTQHQSQQQQSQQQQSQQSPPPQQQQPPQPPQPQQQHQSQQPGQQPAAPTPMNPSAQRPPMVHLVHDPRAYGGLLPHIQGPHPFGRLPMQPTGLSMAANISPMMYMEVRPQDEQSGVAPTINPLTVTSPEFDDFLPCHSRHLSHPPRSDAHRPETVINGQQRTAETASAGNPASSTTAAPSAPSSLSAEQLFRMASNPTRPSRVSVEIPPTVLAAPFVPMADFMNEVLRRSESAEGGNETGDAAVGGLTSAMFNSLLQGVMEEVAGVMRGQQSTNTVAHFLRNLPDFTYTTVDFPRESFLFDLFMTMAEHMTFRDLMGLFFGQPEVFNPLHEHLRTFTRQRVLGGGDFSETSVRSSTLSLVNQAVPILNSAVEEANIRPNVDFVATMISFIHQRLHDIVLLIGAPGENPNFGQLIMEQMRHSLTQGTALALSCFTDGSTSLERLFLTQLRRVSDGVHPAVQQWTINTSLTRLRTLVSTINMEQLNPTIQPLVMDNERGRSFMAVWNAELGEAMDTDSPPSDTTTAATEAPAAATEATAAPATTSVEEEAMIVEEVSTGSPNPSGRRMLERLRQEVAHKSVKEEPEANLDVVLGSESWHDEVPREWVPVIARDIQRQNRMTATPLSEAYIAGIPAKRRKLATGNRPNSNPQLLLRETMERALRAANVSAVTEISSSTSGNGELSVALLPEIRRLGAARIDSDTDFEAERFPNAEKYFHGSV